MARYRDELFRQMDDGLISPRDMAEACLRAMSEADCEDLAWHEWNIDLDEEDDEEEKASPIWTNRYRCKTCGHEWDMESDHEAPLDVCENMRCDDFDQQMPVSSQKGPFEF